MKKNLLKMNFNYLVLLLIFKNISIILPFSFADFNNYFWVFIPICYLVTKFMFIKELEAKNLLKKKYVIPILISYTLLNFVLGMPILYTIFMAIFILILRGPNVVDEEETARIIKEYY